MLNYKKIVSIFFIFALFTACPEEKKEGDIVTPDAYDVKADVCIPNCKGKECGDNGCGGSCGKCPDGKACTPDYKCVVATECGVCYGNLTCGFDPENPDWCAGPDCGDIGYEGKCIGDIVVFCEKEKLYSIDCAFLSDGQNKCAYDEKEKYYDCICKPNCAGKVCGDDGCGGSCGKCAGGHFCDEGKCALCTCEGKECGDDGCGKSCGTCPEGKLCGSKNTCVLATDCGACKEGLICGADKENEKWCVGYECGDITVIGKCEGEIAVFCENNKLYSIDCVFLSDGAYECGYDVNTGLYDCICEPKCEGKECGDDGCEGSCGKCPEGFFCNDSQKCQKCDCAGKVCGDDGCGNSCGVCPTGFYCTSENKCKEITISACCAASNKPGCKEEPETEKCVCKKDPYCCKNEWDLLCVKEVQEFGCGVCCIPKCEGKQCGSDECGGTCGTCPPGYKCNIFGKCEKEECKPNCIGKECGDDGCGGSCGECSDGYGCNEYGKCIKCECLIGQQCGTDTCGNPVCGSCPEGQYCNPENKCVVCGCGGLQCGQGPCGEDCGICFEGFYCKEGKCVPYSGDCCKAKDTPGCGDATIAKCVCDIDPYCCEIKWDNTCVAKVEKYECGTCP